MKLTSKEKEELESLRKDRDNLVNELQSLKMYIKKTYNSQIDTVSKYTILE